MHGMNTEVSVSRVPSIYFTSNAMASPGGAHTVNDTSGPAFDCKLQAGGMGNPGKGEPSGMWQQPIQRKWDK